MVGAGGPSDAHESEGDSWSQKQQHQEIRKGSPKSENKRKKQSEIMGTRHEKIGKGDEEGEEEGGKRKKPETEKRKVEHDRET
jgi:hypothetical protein